MKDNIIETQALTYAYEEKAILEDLQLNVPTGSIYGFLGPNGAGKTTTIRLLLGLLNAPAATVRLFGKDIEKQRMEILARTGNLIETPSLYGHLSGRQNLELFRRLYNAPSERIDVVLEMVKMTAHAKLKCKKYSLGMKQRLGLAIALLNDPELLILDEPTNGLDPSGIVEIRQLILDLNREHGKTIFLSSHLLSEIELMATHVGIIDKGKLCFEGSLEQLHLLNQSSLCIRTDQVEQAAKLLHLKEFRILKQSRHSVEIALDDHQQIAELNQYLIENGVKIFGLENTKPTLENYFMNLTNPGSKDTTPKAVSA